MDSVFASTTLILLLLQTICYCTSRVIVRDAPAKKGMTVTNYYVPIPTNRLLDRVFKKQKRGFLECAEVLTNKQCKVLTELALDVGMPEVSVMDAIADAKLQGASNHNDIFDKALHYLQLRMACDMLISEHECLKILRAAYAKKIAYNEVDGVLQHLIAQGVEDKEVLKQKLMEFIQTGGTKQDNFYGGNALSAYALIKSEVKKELMNDHKGHYHHHPSHENHEGHGDHHHHENHDGHKEHLHENHEGHEHHHHENHEGHEEHHHENHNKEHHDDKDLKELDELLNTKRQIWNYQRHGDTKFEDSKDNSISQNDNLKDSINIDDKERSIWNHKSFEDDGSKQSETSMSKKETKDTNSMMTKKQIGDSHRIRGSNLQNPDDSKAFSDQNQIKATIFDFRKRQIWNHNRFGDSQLKHIDDDRISSNQEENFSDNSDLASVEADAKLEKNSLAPAMWPIGRFGEPRVRSVNIQKDDDLTR